MAVALDANLGSVESATAGTTHTLTTGAAVAAGALVVVMVGVFSNFSGGVASVSGGGLTWTIDHEAGSYLATAIASAPAPSGLASGQVITVTLDASLAPCFILAASFTGVDTGSGRVVDSDSGNADLSAAWSTAALTVTSGDLVVAACTAVGGGSTFTNTPGGGLTELHDIQGTGQDESTGAYLVADASSETPSGTWSGTPDTYQAIAVAYAAGAVPSATILFPMMR